MDETLIHSPLRRWAQTRGDQAAIDNGHTALSFTQLWQSVQTRAEELQRSRAPRTVALNSGNSTLDQLVEFLSVVASGRCAVVADADWPPELAQQVLTALDQQYFEAPPPQTSSSFYIGFTSGSTGLPKGFERSHRSWVDSLEICLNTFGAAAFQRVLAPGRISHSLFLFGMVLGLYSGGGVVVQEKFSATQTLHTLQAGQTPCLVAVPSQLLLLLALAKRKALAPMPAVELILISGARWMRQRTPALQALFPRARIVEFYGASETSFVAWMDANAQAPEQAVGRPFANVELAIRNRDAQGVGQIYVRSSMLFKAYVGQHYDHTQAHIDGDWISVGDMGYLNQEGLLCLVGRENRMLVTQGKNLFPEEVEQHLLRHPAVQQASVQGLPDALRGQQVVAVVQTKPGIRAHDLSQWCRQQLEAYKVPRRFVVCTEWPLTSSGKTDHAAVLRHLSEHAPCIHPLS